MNQEGIIKALKGLTFSGNDEDWSRWSKSFLISADVKGYRELLTGEVEIPTKYEEDNIKHEIIRKNKFLSIKILQLVYKIKSHSELFPTLKIVMKRG